MIKYIRNFAVKIAAKSLDIKIKSSSAKLQQASQVKLLKAFQNTYKNAAWYRRIVAGGSSSVKPVNTIEQWQKNVPIINKEIVFKNHSISELLEGKNLSDATSVLVSSGTSGVFAFGLKTHLELSKNAFATDTILHHYFSAFSKTTLLISCLPMGSRVYSGLTQCEVGPHAERALSAIQMGAKHFEQILVIGIGHLFLKRLIDHGVRCDLSWKDIPVHFLCGGEAIPEGARQYITRFWNDSDSKLPRLIASGGMTELYANSMMFETPDTIKVRRAMLSNAKLRRAITGSDSKAVPMLFAYNPLTTYLETFPPEAEIGDLVASNLDTTSFVRLLRYNMGDSGKILSAEQIKSILSQSDAKSYTPNSMLPWVVFWGRSNKDDLSAQKLRELQNEIQEAIYEDSSLAFELTGNFTMTECESSETCEVLFQAQRWTYITKELQTRLCACLAKWTRQNVSCEIKPFHQFANGMDISFENKCSYSVLPKKEEVKNTELSLIWARQPVQALN